MAGGTLSLPGEQQEMRVPHILKDGADSVGVPGATIRVYVNIGLFSEYWLTRHNRLIGLTPQQPFEVSYAQKHSVFWRATEERLGNIAAFFRRLKSFRLADAPAVGNAPAGASYISNHSAIMNRGKIVFAENCAYCHSSKQPPAGIEPQSADGKAWFRTAVMARDFLEDNFLSNDQPYSLTKIQTNSARAFGTNAMAGHVWDNFSSQDYKQRQAPDELEFFNPFDETQKIKFQPKAKKTGPGYYRVPSLVSLWSSAPFLHNNALGKFTGDPSVAGRLEAYNDAAGKLLWPEKREGKNSIWRTQNECYLHLRKEFVPAILRPLADADGYVKLGPVPKGTPVNLLANLEPDFGQLAVLQAKLSRALVAVHARNLQPDEARTELLKTVPELLAANKCPDFIEDEGHYFGTDLPDEDKRALIEYMKTF
jgi:cytochrome c5